MSHIPADVFPGISPEDVNLLLSSTANGGEMLTGTTVRGMILPRNPKAHKYDFGHALLIAGSEGKGGAAILAARAAMRSGCGLLTAVVPEAVRQAMLAVLPEAMTVLRSEAREILPALSRYHAIGFGPGAGTDGTDIIESMLADTAVPQVIDADGLSILAQHKEWYASLAGNRILTPHAGEFDRLTIPHSHFYERVQTQLAFSLRNRVVVLLKGRYTAITTPEGNLYFNTTGNSGMATAGSGDVLTGILLSLLAQGYGISAAARLGAYLHGAAGDIAAGRFSENAMIASDIITFIGEWFLKK